MARIPMDVIYSILLKLPIQSLLCFKCVSKSWKTVITSPDFARCHNLSSDENRLHISRENEYTLRLCMLDSPLTPISCFSLPFPHPLVDMTILASCEYFLLVDCCDSLYESHVILLNPSTRIHSEIMWSRRWTDSVTYYPKHGMYLDKANDELKVIRICYWRELEKGDEWVTMIYSTKTSSWRQIEREFLSDVSYVIASEPGCVSNNLFYMMFHNLDDNRNVRIGCFDTQAEKWTNDVRLPHNLFVYTMCVFEGLLCVLGYEMNDNEESLGLYSAWIMMNNGAKDSFVKLMTIGSNVLGPLQYCPIAYHNRSQHEILCREVDYTIGYPVELFWYNLRDKSITNVDFTGYPTNGSKYFSDHICIGSLRSFPDRRTNKLTTSV